MTSGDDLSPERGTRGTSAGRSARRPVPGGLAALVALAALQLTADEGQPEALGDVESRTFAVGPQVGYNFEVGGASIYANLRGYVEFDVQNRTEGGSVFLTIDLPLSALAHRRS